MKKKTIIASIMILILNLPFITARVQAQSFSIRPFAHADLLLLDYPDFVNSFNFGFGADALLGSTSKAGLELGWGTLDDNWWAHNNEFELEFNRTSTFRILAFYELEPGDKKLFFQIGGGINISMPYANVWPDFMLGVGINVFKSEKISIPLLFRVDCIANSEVVFIPANLTIGITFKL
jgi:hypothetical protein